MANEVDIAQEYMIDQNMVASSTISAMMAIKNVFPSELHCLDCGYEIPEQRRQTGGIEFCVECQTLREKYPNVRFDSKGKVFKEVIADE